MAWRAAPAVKSALAEATARWPKRNKKSDGTVSSRVHKTQNPDSDHDPDERGVVTAFDLTHSPEHGCDAHALIRRAVARRDPRIKYAISEDRIWSARRADEGWRKYDPNNPKRNRHEKHAHVSVNRQHEDDTSPWWPPLPALKVGDNDMEAPPTIAVGSTDQRTVRKLRALLRIPHGRPQIAEDGPFDALLAAEVKDFQSFHKLDADGVVGPATWRVLVLK